MLVPTAPPPRLVANVSNTTRDPSPDGRAMKPDDAFEPSPFNPTRLIHVGVACADEATTRAPRTPTNTSIRRIPPPCGCRADPIPRGRAGASAFTESLREPKPDTPSADEQ